MRGKFVAIEGIDGAGKTRLVHAIGAKYVAGGARPTVHTTAEPTHGETGRRIREILAGRAPNPGPEEMRKLFAQDRKEHVEAIVLPTLEAGVHVVCDRYIDSSVVYGLAKDDTMMALDGTLTEAGRVFLSWILHLNEGVPTPDVTVLLDLPLRAARERMRAEKRGSDLYDDDTPMLARVRAAYQALPALFPDRRYVRVDAAQPFGAVLETVCLTLDNAFAQAG